MASFGSNGSRRGANVKTRLRQLVYGSLRRENFDTFTSHFTFYFYRFYARGGAHNQWDAGLGRLGSFAQPPGVACPQAASPWRVRISPRPELPPASRVAITFAKLFSLSADSDAPCFPLLFFLT